jgi:hypothetical protein
MKDLWLSASQFWKIIPDLKAVKNPDPSHSDPKIRGKEPKTLSKRAHNPLYEKRGWADQADSRPPLRGPGAG